MRFRFRRFYSGRKLTRSRRANEESILAIQIFDQKKFKKKDQGFLGVINVRIGSVMDLEIGGDGMLLVPHEVDDDSSLIFSLRNAYKGLEKV